METKRTKLWRRKQGFRVFKARMIYSHHSSANSIGVTVRIMYPCIGLNWQKNIGRRSIVQQEHHAVV